MKRAYWLGTLDLEEWHCCEFPGHFFFFFFACHIYLEKDGREVCYMEPSIGTTKNPQEFCSFSVQFSSVTQSCLTLCNPMDCSMPDFAVGHQLPELTQTHVHWVGDAIQPSHPLSSPSPTTLNLSQHQGLFKWVSSSHQVAKGLELQLQHQSFQWTPRTDLL